MWTTSGPAYEAWKREWEEALACTMQPPKEEEKKPPLPQEPMKSFDPFPDFEVYRETAKGDSVDDLQGPFQKDTWKPHLERK